jgi:hypothetical protein
VKLSQQRTGFNVRYLRVKAVELVQLVPDLKVVLVCDVSVRIGSPRVFRRWFFRFQVGKFFPRFFLFVHRRRLGFGFANVWFGLDVLD